MQLEDLKIVFCDQAQVWRERQEIFGEGGCMAGKSGMGGASGLADEGSQSIGLKTPVQQAYMCGAEHARRKAAGSPSLRQQLASRKDHFAGQMALILPIKVSPTLGNSFSLFLNIYACAASLPSLIPLGA